MENIYRHIKVGKEIDGVWIELEIYVDQDLKPYQQNIGSIRISSIYITNEEKCSWDNLDFFFNASKKDIKRECKKELEFKNLYVKGIFKTMRELIEETRRLGLYHEQGSK